jgi:hypothetical protein
VIRVSGIGACDEMILLALRGLHILARIKGTHRIAATGREDWLFSILVKPSSFPTFVLWVR